MPFENVTRDGRIFWLTEASRGAADRRSQRARRRRHHARRSGSRRSSGSRCRRSRSSPTPRSSGSASSSAPRRSWSDPCRWTATRSSSARAASPSTPAACGPTSRSGGRCPSCSPPSSGSRAAWRRRRPTSSADIEKQHPPVTVFEAFIKGLLAETPATAISYLRAALAGQPSFDRARLALWDVYTEQGDHALALTAVTSVAEDSPWFRRARFLAGALAARPQEIRRCVRDVQGAGGRRSGAGRVEQPRCRAAASRRGAAVGPADVLLQARRPKPIPTTRISCSTWGTRTGSIAIRRRPSTGCAKRCGATRPTPTRTSCSPRRWPAAATPPKPRASASWRAGCPRHTSPASGPAGDAVPKGLERVKQVVELPHARQIGDAAGDERAAQQRGARAVLSRARTAAVSAGERSGRDRRIEPRDLSVAVSGGRRTCCSGARSCGSAACTKRSTRSRSRCGAPRPPRPTPRSARRTGRRRTGPRRARKPTRALALDPASVDAKQLLARIDSR